MPEAFDPFHIWLGIAPEEQPPNHYRLLGIKLFETNSDVIESAVDRQMAHVRSFQGGKHAAESQKVLNELSAAKLCLLSADKKATYDQALKAKLPRPQLAVAKPLRKAQAVVPAPPNSAAENPLGFDPLAENSAPRQRKRKSSAQQPALLAGAGVALLAVIGLIWTFVSGSGDPPSQHSARSTPAADQGSNRSDPSDRTKPVADRMGKPKSVSPPSADNSDPARASADNSPGDAVPAADDDDSSAATADSMPAEDLDDPEIETADVPPKAAVPDGDALKTAIAAVHSLFKTELSAAKKPEQKVALAEKLLGMAGDNDSPIERYALLSEARRLAAGAGAAGLAMQAIDLLAKEFEVERLDLAAEMLDGLSDKDLPAARKDLVEVVLPLIDEAAAAGQFKLARHLAKVGLAAARKSKQTDAIKLLEQQTHDLAAQEPLAEAAGIARQHLATSPDDSESHLTLGKYLCLVAGDWGAGLLHLKQGSDAALRGIAERELEGADLPADRVKVGNLWWDLADEQKGLENDRYRARAGYWYEQAIGGLTGVSKIKIEKRLTSLTSNPHFATAARRPDRAASAARRPDSHSGKTLFLSELPAEDIRHFEGVELTRPVVFKGRPSPHGLFLHPADRSPSHVAYAVPRGYRTFEGVVGINDTASFPGRGGSTTALTFRIVADGELLWTSRPLIDNGDSQEFRLSIDRVKELELFVDCPGPPGMGHAIWIEPRLVGAPDRPARVPATASRGGVIADKLVLWNCRSIGYNDRGTRTANIELRQGGQVVWSKSDVPVAWSEDAEPATTIPLPKISCDAVRVEAVSYHGGGPALCEVEVFRGRDNLARGKPVTTSGILNSNVPASAVVDGIRDSSQLHVGYWIGPNLQSAWVEVRLVDPATTAAATKVLPTNKRVRATGTPSFLVELPPHDIRVYQYAGGGLKTEGLSFLGVPSLHGFLLHPTANGSSHVAFALAELYQSLAGMVGVSDSAHGGSEAPLTFRIVGDGREIWKSRPLRQPGETQEFQVSVANLRGLELFVDCPGGDGGAHAAWIDPQLTMARARPKQAASDPLKGAVLIATFDEPTIARKNGELRVRDLSGKQKPGLILGATPVPGKSGQALSFQTAGDHVDWGDDPSLNPSAFTACAWIKPAAHDSLWADILDKYQGDTGHKGFVLRMHGKVPDITIGVGDGSWYEAHPELVVPLNEWTHLAATYDDKSQTLYVNAQPAVSRPSSGPIAVAPIRCYVGMADQYHDRQFTGLIDEVAFFDHALSAAEVRRIYQLGASGQSLAAGLAPPKASRPADEPRSAPVATVDKKPPKANAAADGTLPAGARLYLSFAKDTTSAAGDSLRVNDLSGRSNSATSAGAAALIKGKVGQALALNGGELRLTPLLNGLPNFTFSAWICTVGSGEFLVFEEGNSGGPAARILLSASREIELETWNFNGPPDNWLRSHTKADAVPAGKWCHLAVRLVDGTASNGKAIVSVNGKSFELPSQAMRGHASTYARLGGTGSALMDEVAIFDRALTDAELDGIYQTGRKQKMLAPAK